MLLGYDGEIKKYIFGSVDNTGSYEAARAGGWDKDVITFEGPIHTGTATFTARDAFTKKGTSGIGHVFSLQERDGTWRKVEEDHCTRAK